VTSADAGFGGLEDGHQMSWTIDQEAAPGLPLNPIHKYHLHPTLPLMPPPRRFRARTSRDTPLIAAPHFQPLFSREAQIPIQLGTGFLAMDEVAESGADASLSTIEATARFPEVGDGGEFAVDGPGGVPAGVEGVAGLLRAVFVLEAGVDVADEMVVVVVADDDFLDLTVLAHLAPEILIEGVEMVLKLRWVHLVFGVVGWILVEVGEEDGLGV